MQFKKLVLTAAAIASTPAFALSPAQVGGATQLWVTGASAHTNAVFQSVMSLCAGMRYVENGSNIIRTNPGVLNTHIYLEGAGAEPGKSSGDRMAYACEVKTDDDRAGGLENTKIVVYHTVEGGSFNAYSPALVAVGETSPYLPTTMSRVTEVADLSAPSRCANGVGTPMALKVSDVVNNAGPGTGIVRYNDCGLTDVTLATGAVNVAADKAPVVPVGGFSDIEYAIFKQNLNLATGVDAIGYVFTAAVGQAFGVAVSYPLYYKLQQNDIASGSLAATCDDAPSTATAPNLTLACQPNMPSSRYTTAANSATSGGVNASLFGGLATDKVHLVMLGPKHGARAASDIRFLNAPCATGDAGGALTPTRTADSTTTLLVSENSTTRNVKTKLNAATGANQYAMGVVSMENKPEPTPTADRWAFVKLDGISPGHDYHQLTNAKDGSYSFWYESEMFLAASAVGTPGETLLYSINYAFSVLNVVGSSYGLFVLPTYGAITSSIVGKVFRGGNSCAPVVQ